MASGWHRESRRHSLAAKGIKTTSNPTETIMNKSIRKPYNDRAGYIASLRSGKNKGWVVIYKAKEAGIDDKDGKYAVVCESHNQILNTKNLPSARTAMKAVDFCTQCSR